MMIVEWLKAKALLVLAVLLVLFGAYVMGGRAARRSAESKRNYDEALRAAAGSKGVHDAEVEVQKMPAGAAADQLRRDWMRDGDTDAAATDTSAKGNRRDGT
jgi:hypothetical protein